MYPNPISCGQMDQVAGSTAQGLRICPHLTPDDLIANLISFVSRSFCSVPRYVSLLFLHRAVWNEYSADKPGQKPNNDSQTETNSLCAG